MQGLFLAFMIDTDAPQCSAVFTPPPQSTAHGEGVMGGGNERGNGKGFGDGCSRDEGLQLLMKE